MSDEKPKPFARVEERGTGWGVDVGARYVGHWETRMAADLAAEHLNAAVERREARLKAAMLDVANDLWHASQRNDMVIWVAGIMQKAGDALRAAAGTNPDYVPRAELDAANAKVKALQAVNDLITDVLGDDRLHLQNAREVAAQAAAHLEAAGLREPGVDPETGLRVLSETGKQELLLRR